MSQVRYEILGPLIPGEGSRPSLALALEDGAPPRPVVLVWAPADVVQDAAMLSRLRRETERAVVFEHPNILRVHGLVTLDGRVARVTEFADGESLRQVLEAGRLPLPFAALIAADVAKGVHYAHVAGNDDGTPLIHGDIRPETVMVSFNGVCKVSGYGALGVAPRERNGRRVRNRRLYSAPEQLMGGREASSVLTDVFLLGLLLYECLSGRKPFQDSIDQDKAILNRPLPPLPAEVPLRYNEVVRRATAKRSGDRYPSALAFRDALVEVAGELSSSAAFAEHLTKVIPANGEARVARKKMIEQGIAEVASRASPTTASTPIIRGAAPAYTPPPISGSAPTITAPMPVIAPAAPPAPGTPSPAGPEAPIAAVPPVAPPGAAPARSRRLAVPIAVGIGALLFVSAVGTVWSTRKKADLAIPDDAGEATVNFEPPVLLEAEPPDAGTIQKATPTPGVTRTMVSLSVSPSVAVAVDGRPIGASPLTVPLAPGRHLLTFTDESKGLKTARLIDVRATTDTVSFTIRLGMGSVLLHAPSGAKVSLDGQDLGTAPLAERTLFEGEHTLRVTQNGAVWERAFVLQGDQRLVFNADFEPESE